MEALVISSDFTIEDIHKIREQNYERTKDMTVAEKVAYYNNSGKEAESCSKCMMNLTFLKSA